MGVCGNEDVRYSDFTSGGVGMTMIVRLSGGPKAIIEPPLIIYTNKYRIIG